MKILAKYELRVDNVIGKVEIKRVSGEFVPIYELKMPYVEVGTRVILNKIKEFLIAEVPVKPTEILDLTAYESLKKKFVRKAMEIVKRELPNVGEEICKFLVGKLLHETLGFEKLELLIEDPNLEEIVVNNSREPVWVYHRKFGWLKTNVYIANEMDIQNYASIIARRVGRQITLLDPLLDAHLTSGDRANATLFPISTKGNTLTIRKFRRSPWTITDFLENKTLDFEVAAWLWLAIQYEMNILIAGGTASGKTSLLNVLMCFIPPNHRVISIEDTRELQLPEFLHWVPLTTRQPNPEGLGEVSMLDLLVNSLRMRPDRIIVGEVRRGREAEVLFEAMHTGHSVYATLHADTAEQAYKRLVNPPINIPEILLESLHLIAVCFRDRRKGIRRLFQVAEILPGERGINLNLVYRWKPLKDKVEKENESFRVKEELRMFTGMSDEEMEEEIKEKVEILKWLVKNKVKTVNAIGLIVSNYYTNKDWLMKLIRKNVVPTRIIAKQYL